MVTCPYCRATLGADAEVHVLACHLAALNEGHEREDVTRAMEIRKHREWFQHVLAYLSKEGRITDDQERAALAAGLPDWYEAATVRRVEEWARSL